jgi:parvulin-like peptidyl-prolyl isomerase
VKTLVIALMAVLLVVGCAREEKAEAPKEQVTRQEVTKDEATKVVQPTPPGHIRASHILISYSGAPRTTATRSKEEAKKLAEELLAKIQGGASFEEIAEAYSDCPSAAKKGDLGFFAKGRMVKPFEDAAFALKVGEVSGIVESPFGYHIIKRTQ